MEYESGDRVIRQARDVGGEPYRRNRICGQQILIEREILVLWKLNAEDGAKKL
jgi:hypothetical protein